MRTIALSFCLIVFAFSVNAQNKGKISGKVTDAATKQIINYATVSLFKQGATAPFNGVVTDDKGNFVLAGLAAGGYTVKVEFIGYQAKTLNVSITDAAPSVSLGNVALAPSQNQLQDVVVTAKRPTVENKIDRMVYNPQNDLTAQGGMAIDVLQKVPQISVDIDGNVELLGNTNIRFLINGKPSSIFGSSLTEALQSIPASQIQSIEVITNPGAQYDATGTGGIINIILKQSNVQGVNGSVNLSAGTRLENGSFNLNAKKGNFGVGAFFNGNERINTTTLNHSETRSTDSLGNKTDQLQNGSSAFKRSGYQSGINFQWDVTKKDQLTASFSYNHFGNTSVGTTNQELIKTGISNDILQDQLSTLSSSSNFHANSSDFSLGYKKSFDKKDEELDFLVNTSLGSNYNYASQQTVYLDGNTPTSGSMSTNPGTDRETDISLDYKYPFSKNFLFQTGAKATIEDISNSVITDTLLNNGNITSDPAQTYNFGYNRQIYAYYASTTFSLFHDFINGMAGLRYEYTTTSSSFPGTNVPGYGILAPSFVLQHKLSDDESVKFSYSYRLQRPEYSDVDPFYNVSDPHNISTGDPNLKPEYGHNYELGYNKSFNNGPSLYVSAFYRYNTNDIQSLTTFYSILPVNGTDYTDVELTTRANIGSETNEGVNLYFSIPAGKLTLRSNNYFADRISKNPFDPLNPGDPTRVSGFAYRLNLNASYEFAPSFAAEVFGNYRSSQRTIQGESPAFSFYNFAVRKQFWKKTASIGITAANPFASYIAQTTTTNTGNSYQTSTREVPFRSFGISLNYKFGKLEFKKPAKEDVPDDTATPNKVPDSTPR
ncbi:TonB-dependent receptor [Mucilaginibacter sp.]